METKCTTCGALLGANTIAEEKKKETTETTPIAEDAMIPVPHALAQELEKVEEENDSTRIVIQLIKLESLALVLYYASLIGLPWYFTFAICLGALVLLASLRFRILYVIGLSAALGFLLTFEVFQIEQHGWWLAGGIFVVSAIIHLPALSRYRKLSDVVQ